MPFTVPPHPPSRRHVLSDLEGGIKILEVCTKQSLLCSVSYVVIIPFRMALLNQCFTQIFGFWQLRLGGGGGGLR